MTLTKIAGRIQIGWMNKRKQSGTNISESSGARVSKFGFRGLSMF